MPSRWSRFAACAVVVATASGAGTAACSFGSSATEAITAAPSVAFDSKRMGPLFAKAVALGDTLAVSGWRASGWVAGDKVMTRTWCTGGSAPVSCTALGDADGVRSAAAYQVSAELRGADSASGGLGVRVAYQSSAVTGARTMQYRDVSYSSAQASGFGATVRMGSGSAAGEGGVLVVAVTDTPSYQPTYLDPSGRHSQIGSPMQLGTDVAAADQLKTLTGSATSMAARMAGRLAQLYSQVRYKLKITNSDQGICALDNQPNCPAAKLTAAERQSALNDLDAWYTAQRRAVRTEGTAIVQQLNAPFAWAALLP